MGADIHGVLQERWNDSDKWRTIAEIEDDRNYWLFSVLAGVRNYGGITPISDPRGLPEDLELVDDDKVKMTWARYDVWLGDHSRSWLTIEEIRDWPGWDEVLDGADESFREGCQTFLAWLHWADLKTGWHEENQRRIVFGFDS